MKEPRVIWEPMPGSQTKFLQCPIKEVLYEGTRGPGKTDALIMDFAQFVGQGYGAFWRGILFRQTYKQLEDVVAKTRRWFHQIFPEARFNEGNNVWKWSDGEQLLLRYMDVEADYWNYHGHEYPWIGWEELTNWKDNKCYESMKSCNRSSCPNPTMPRRIRSTANPWGVGHSWVKEHWVDPAPAMTVMVDDKGNRRVRITGKLSENTILNEVDPEYVKTLESVTDEAKRKAWLEGDWDVAAGGIFGGVWDSAVHVVEPFNIPKSWYVDRSFDWGSSRPFSVCWWAESDGTEATMPDGSKKCWPKGTIFHIGEWYGWNGRPNEGACLLSGQIAKGIKEREELMARKVYPGSADNSIFDTQDGHCIADDMGILGIGWERSDKSPGSRMNGWERLRQYMYDAAQEPQEKPGLFIFNTCRHWLRTVPTLPRDPKRPDDVDTDAEDHAGDATRYRVLMPKKIAKTVTMRL